MISFMYHVWETNWFVACCQQLQSRSIYENDQSDKVHNKVRQTVRKGTRIHEDNHAPKTAIQPTQLNSSSPSSIIGICGHTPNATLTFPWILTWILVCLFFNVFPARQTIAFVHRLQVWKPEFVSGYWKWCLNFLCIGKTLGTYPILFVIVLFELFSADVCCLP